MSDPINSASIYTDFNGLADLRMRSGQDSPEAREEVAKQFEALFIQTMLKSMRDASPAGSGSESDQVKFYQDMFDKQIALNLAEGQGIGLAKVFARHLGNAPDVLPAPTEALRPLVTNNTVHSLANNPVVDQKQVATEIKVIATDPEWHPSSPDEFIRDLWPQAKTVARGLGVQPEVLVAQAALETGWGRKIIHDQDGRSSFNLFNIKADSSWHGQRVAVPTLEYRDGIAVREHASFRAYDSLVESMQDYVAFMKNNPRYQTALESVSDTEQYLHELQSAGYATDPHYAEKIGSILNRDYFNNTVVELKVSEKRPLS